MENLDKIAKENAQKIFNRLLDIVSEEQSVKKSDTLSDITRVSAKMGFIDGYNYRQEEVDKLTEQLNSYKELYYSVKKMIHYLSDNNELFKSGISDFRIEVDDSFEDSENKTLPVKILVKPNSINQFVEVDWIVTPEGKIMVEEKD